MEEQTTRNSVIGKSLAAADRGPNELERAAGNLMEQNELISMLDGRLDVVSHRTPVEPRNENKQSGPHIGVIADAIADNNRKLRTLLEQLAI